MSEQYYDIERRTAIKEDARMFRRKFFTYEQAEVMNLTNKIDKEYNYTVSVSEQQVDQ